MTTFLAEGLQLSEISKSVKETIVRAIDNHDGNSTGLTVAAVGLALTALQKQHPEIVLDPARPMEVYFSTLPYRKEIGANVLEHFEKYAEMLEKVYAESAQAEAEAFVQEIVDAFYGPGTKIEGWQVKVASPEGQEPTTFEGGDVAGLNQLTAGEETFEETDRATENTDLNQGPIASADSVVSNEQPAAALRDSMEAAHVSKRLPCGGLI